MSTLYLDGVIHSTSDPYATAMTVEDGLISWLGSDDTAERMRQRDGASGGTTQQLDGALVAPAFVDSWSTAGTADPAAAGIFLTAGTAPGAQVRYAPVTSADDLPDDDGAAGWVVDLAPGQDPVRVVTAAVDRGVPLVLVPRAGEEDGAEAAVQVLVEAAQATSTAALARCQPRLVWNGPISAPAIEALAGHSASVTVVPDAQGRVHAPVGSLLSAGVPVSWGSGERESDPWAAIRALLDHADEQQRISARSGFTAATRTGLRVMPAAALEPAAQLAGRLTPSAPATFAVWEVEALSVQAPDGRVSAWSTDARAGTPLLPVLDEQTAPPRLLATLSHGQTLYSA